MSLDIDVNEWKLTYDNTVLGQVLSFTSGLDQTKIVSKALDGTIYIQTVGSAIKKAEISVISSLEEKEWLDEAEASGAFISVKYRYDVYHGYIESVPQWETVYPGKWYTCKIVLLIED